MATSDQPNAGQPAAEDAPQQDPQAGTKLGDLVEQARLPREETSVDAEAGPQVEADQPAQRPRPIVPSDRSGGYYWGTGRRKRAVARVRIKPGSGTFLINKRQVDGYFTQERDRKLAVAALHATGTKGQLDVFVNLSGGGYTGQAGAVLLGVARALKAADPTLEKMLREQGYLTRDSRMKERKKYGQRGARRRFQFSKR